MKTFPTLRRLFLALLGCILFAPLAAAPAVKGQRILFVVDVKIPEKFHLVDLDVQHHLEAMGFIVTMVDHEDEAGCRTDDKDMVIVSSTVSGQTVADRFRDTPLPVVTWEAYISYHMRMTGKFQEVDYYCDHRTEEFNYLWMVNAPHPIAAGLPNGLFKPFKRPQLPPPEGNAQINWAHPGPGASIIATVPGEPRKAGIFCYEKGAMMDSDFVAPARRLMLFLHSDGFDELNADGVKLFDAAILWASGQIR